MSAYGAQPVNMVAVPGGYPQYQQYPQYPAAYPGMVPGTVPTQQQQQPPGMYIVVIGSVEYISQIGYKTR